MAWPPLPELFSDMENHGMDRALFQPVIHGRLGVKRLGRLGFATVQTNMNLLLYSIIYIHYQNTFLVEGESINNCTIAKIKCTTMVSRFIINRINHQSVFCY